MTRTPLHANNLCIGAHIDSQGTGANQQSRHQISIEALEWALTSVQDGDG